MKETRRGAYNTDEPFDEIVLEKIKPEIARAFILLESTLRWKTITPIGQETNRSVQRVRGKADQMKNEINNFIDAQVKMLMDGIESRAETGFRDSGSQEEERKPIIINEERARYGLSPISGGDVPITRISDENSRSEGKREVKRMNEKQLLMRVSVDSDSLLGKVAAIEKKAEDLRFEAMHLRESISCRQVTDEEKPEA